MILNLLVRLLLFVAAAIASWFVASDALNFVAYQLAIALLLFLAVIAVVVFWPTWRRKLRGSETRQPPGPGQSP